MPRGNWMHYNSENGKEVSLQFSVMLVELWKQSKMQKSHIQEQYGLPTCVQSMIMKQVVFLGTNKGWEENGANTTPRMTE